MVELTDFLKNIGNLSAFGGTVDLGTSESRGGQVFGTNGGIESGLSTRNIINRIEAIVDRNLVGSPQFQFEQVQVPLFDLSKSINEQITIRENQRAADQEQVRNQQIAQTSINEQFTNSLADLSKSLGDIGKGGGDFDPIKFFTDNPLIGGIGIGGLAVGAVVLFLLIKR